jgi:hypothetical protein
VPVADPAYFEAAANNDADAQRTNPNATRALCMASTMKVARIKLLAILISLRKQQPSYYMDMATVRASARQAKLQQRAINITPRHRARYYGQYLYYMLETVMFYFKSSTSVITLPDM